MGEEEWAGVPGVQEGQEEEVESVPSWPHPAVPQQL